MSKVITLGGERLGAGKGMEVEMHGFNRSTHDLSGKFRSSMSAGTVVPCGWYLGLPGDKFEIDLQAECMTKPTLGPLYGTYKIQVDAFITPLRLYARSLMINRTDVGLDMANVHLPQMLLGGTNPVLTEPTGLNRDFNTYQINSSSLARYMGIAGIGTAADTMTSNTALMTRKFNGLKLLQYWDIIYSYYTNKQEENGYVVHNNLVQNEVEGDANAELTTPSSGAFFDLTEQPTLGTSPTAFILREDSMLKITWTAITELNPESIYIQTTATEFWKATDVFATWEIDATTITFRNPTIFGLLTDSWYIDNTPESILNTSPNLEPYQLRNIPKMRMNLMAWDDSAPYMINSSAEKPYGLMFKALYTNDETARVFSVQSSQEGLAVKTYLSDVNNNWLNDEYITGENGVNAITAVQVDEEGKFTIDQLNLKNKLYNLLNRIAVTDGTYKAWLEAGYDEEMLNVPSTPVYIGGYSRELVFQEVVSTAATTTQDGQQALGTLAGRGQVVQKQNGGHIEVHVNEPSYISLMVSITPRIDYSQGNKWDMNLKTMDDLHLPSLDEIGFEDLITDRLAWFDSKINPLTGEVEFKSAGKQPAWINYMTDVDEVYGSFARENDEMYMVLNRRYEAKRELFEDTADQWSIKDLTTYIDPRKYNHIFADTRLDAENFQVQVGKKVIARRKMSARLMPNL